MDVILSPSETVHTTLPEYYGTPHYHHKVEWFDVFDRQSGSMLDWTVSRINGKECVVNHPRYGVVTGLINLNAAAEVCHSQYMNEKRALTRSLCDPMSYDEWRRV